jgi:ubiquinone/menaquinone biosynthesis C-methylase UbiE
LLRNPLLTLRILIPMRPLLILLLASYVIAQEAAPTPAVAPPPAVTTNSLGEAVYMDRVIATTMHWAGAAWLVRHKRDKEEAAVKMREALKLQPGMAVCDMGCGNGYHTLPMARTVGETGKIYAVDIQPEMLRMLDERVAKEKLTNVQTFIGADADSKLPAASCDLILMVDVYHEFSQPGLMLQSMKKALKPGGQIVLVEFRTEDPEVPIKPEHKMTKAQVIKELAAAGYEPSGSYDELPWQHMLWFREAKVPAQQ